MDLSLNSMYLKEVAAILQILVGVLGIVQALVILQIFYFPFDIFQLQAQAVTMTVALLHLIAGPSVWLYTCDHLWAKFHFAAYSFFVSALSIMALIYFTLKFTGKYSKQDPENNWEHTIHYDKTYMLIRISALHCILLVILCAITCIISLLRVYKYVRKMCRRRREGRPVFAP